ncbi:MAG: thiol:disulfide interchange protein DsbA/DsbL, partial [Candidatus Thiodiazotropha sp.]
EFVRVPAIFNNPRWEIHAQAFYTAEVLGVLDKFHKSFFDALHKDRLRIENREQIRKFFERIDIDGDTFDRTFDSFAVQSKVRRAADLTKRYGISGVPTIIVNGKYRTDGPMAKSYERLLQIVDTLIKREAS